MKKFTYEIIAGPRPLGALIGWRKTAAQACKFAEQLLKTKTYASVTVLRRERSPEDFSY